MTQRLAANTVPNIAASGQSAGTRLVRNPLRPATSTLFAGWGPRLRV